MASAGRRPVPVELSDRITALHKQGWSLGQIARYLNNHGVPTHQGGLTWYPGTIRLILIRCGVYSPKATR